jgi:hypothetical protein
MEDGGRRKNKEFRAKLIKSIYISNPTDKFFIIIIITPPLLPSRVVH